MGYGVERVPIFYSVNPNDLTLTFWTLPINPVFITHYTCISNTYTRHNRIWYPTQTDINAHSCTRVYNIQVYEYIKHALCLQCSLEKMGSKTRNKTLYIFMWLSREMRYRLQPALLCIVNCSHDALEVVFITYYISISSLTWDTVHYEII